MPDQSDWVEIRHPDLPPESTAPDGGYAQVTAEAFEEVYKPRGWVKVTDAPVTDAPVTPPTPPRPPVTPTITTTTSQGA